MPYPMSAVVGPGKARAKRPRDVTIFMVLLLRVLVEVREVLAIRQRTVVDEVV